MCAPEVWQKGFLIESFVWISVFGEKRDSLAVGEIRESRHQSLPKFTRKSGTEQELNQQSESQDWIFFLLHTA